MHAAGAECKRCAARSRCCGPVSRGLLHQRQAKASRAQKSKHSQVYAWKLLVLEDALRRAPAVLWLDAGSTVVAPLGAVGDALLADGYFLVQVPWACRAGWSVWEMPLRGGAGLLGVYHIACLTACIAGPASSTCLVNRSFVHQVHLESTCRFNLTAPRYPDALAGSSQSCVQPMHSVWGCRVRTWT